MKWLRSNIEHVSRLALFALALQFAAAFGHFHAAVAQAPAVQSVIMPSHLSDAGGRSATAAVDASAQQQPASNPDTDPSSNDLCAICAVIALASAAMFTTPPLLLPPQAVQFLYLATDAEFVHLNSARVAFQPRAPPLS